MIMSKNNFKLWDIIQLNVENNLNLQPETRYTKFVITHLEDYYNIFFG